MRVFLCEKRMSALAMIHTYHEMVINLEQAIDIFLETIQESCSLNHFFSSGIVTLKYMYIDFSVINILCRSDGM